MEGGKSRSTTATFSLNETNTVGGLPQRALFYFKSFLGRRAVSCLGPKREKIKKDFLLLLPDVCISLFLLIQ